MTNTQEAMLPVSQLARDAAADIFRRFPFTLAGMRAEFGDAWLTQAFARFEATLASQPAGGPIPMVLHCPSCHLQHVDEATDTWDNPPHRSHLCHGCGCIWRPADVATTGVHSIATAGSADTWGWDGKSLSTPSVPKQDVLREALEAARSTLANYADPTGYTDNNGDQLEAGEEVHPGLLAAKTLARIEAALTEAPTVDCYSARGPLSQGSRPNG